MQISHVDIEQLAEMLTEGERLATLEGTQRVEVLRWGGVELLAIVCPITSGAVIVSPCSEDADSGGSIHAHARQLQVAG